MVLKKTAQQILFKELAQAEYRAFPDPEYMGYPAHAFVDFEEHLSTLLEKFESELSDNLTNRSPSLRVYLMDMLNIISQIEKRIRKRQSIYSAMKQPKSVGKKSEGLNNFFFFQ